MLSWELNECVTFENLNFNTILIILLVYAVLCHFVYTNLWWNVAGGSKKMFKLHNSPNHINGESLNMLGDTTELFYVRSSTFIHHYQIMLHEVPQYTLNNFNY